MRKGVYSKKALETYLRVTENTNVYIVNKVYLNKDYNIYYYINNKGYLHILEINKCKDYYIIFDNYLNKAGVIKHSGQLDGIFDNLQKAIDYLTFLKDNCFGDWQ